MARPKKLMQQRWDLPKLRSGRILYPVTYLTVHHNEDDEPPEDHGRNITQSASKQLLCA